jgi:hypothetical protein
MIMYMKQREMNNVFEFLKKVQISKVKDRDVKKTLVAAYMSIYKKMEEFDKDIQELRKKYFEGKEDSVREYDSIVQQMQNEQDLKKQKSLAESINPETQELVKEYLEMLNTYLDRDVEVSFETVDKDKFIEALIDLDVEFACDDLIILKALYHE